MSWHAVAAWIAVALIALAIVAAVIAAVLDAQTQRMLDEYRRTDRTRIGGGGGA